MIFDVVAAAEAELFTGLARTMPEANPERGLLGTSRVGEEPIQLKSGEARRFLEDGDDDLPRSDAQHERFAGIGFGKAHANCLGVAAVSLSVATSSSRPAPALHWAAAPAETATVVPLRWP